MCTDISKSQQQQVMFPKKNNSPTSRGWEKKKATNINTHKCYVPSLLGAAFSFLFFFVSRCLVQKFMLLRHSSEVSCFTVDCRA